jgi:hypothetical protein
VLREPLSDGDRARRSLGGQPSRGAGADQDEIVDHEVVVVEVILDHFP